MLEIRLLGEPEVVRDGQAVPLPASKKSRALLAYLAVTGRAHSRERLCELLWEGPDDPRAALRWSLTKLRPLLEPHLVANRDRVEFQCDGATVDISALCVPANATTDQLEKCAALFRGELAEGLDLPGCFRFQQWCAGERERFRQLHIAILRELTERLGSDERAVPYARRRVQIDPFDEQAHAALIRLLASLGRRQEAMQQYEHCRVVFERELSARPGQAVEDARREIAKAPHPASGHPLPVARGEAILDVRFVGRGRELSAIASAQRMMLILGEPGIGKSRLLEELRRRTKGLTRYGRAFAAEMARPYGVWLDVLDDFPTESDRARLFDAVVDKLADVELLQIDDLQWIDEASAALLHYVARKTKLRIVCAARVGEIDDNPYASRLVRDVVKMNIGPLSTEETRALVAASPDRDRVVAESGGNPLFALELARAQSAGTLTQVIASRLAQLESRARDLVSWAAAIGRQFDADILGRATEMPSGEMLTALEKLERCAIIRAGEGGRCYDFAHDLIRDAAYQTISGPRRVLVHRHVARALQSVHDPDSALAGDIVRHASLAGDHSLAVTAAIAAGQRCLRMFAYSEAMSVSRLGLQLADSLPERERIEKQMNLLDVIVTSRTAVRERLPFARQITELMESARKLGLAQTASMGANLLACLHSESDDLARAADATIASAEISRAGDPRIAAYMMANAARCLLFIERDIPRAQSLLGEVETIIKAVGGEHIEIPLGLGYLYAHRGEKELATVQLERAMAMAGREQDHWREWCAGVRLVTLALETRDFDAAQRHCDRLLGIARKMSGGSEGVRTDVFAEIVRFAREGEESDLRTKLDELRVVDCKSDLAWALTFISELELERGHADRARRDAEEALIAAEAVGRASEAALARVILGLDVDRAKWDDLTERARSRVLEKERRHAQHGRRADV
ncbi:MAG TPA: BTAD domain-containing putative transcriptional regulator [Thermoanaerobaculia bacterium]